MKKIITFILIHLSFVVSVAQTTEVEMADTMRANGKIYVILGIILIVLAGFIFYMIRLDRKISRLEKDEQEQMKKQPSI